MLENTFIYCIKWLNELQDKSLFRLYTYGERERESSLKVGKSVIIDLTTINMCLIASAN